MGDGPDQRITGLLLQIGSDADGARAAEELLPLVYSELRKLAGARLRREHGGSQPTSLVHDAYVRLVGDSEYRWKNRAHFFAAAGEAMRRILIERARRRARVKHGGELRQVTLQDDAATTEPPPEELLALDTALGRLEARDRHMSNVVKLRYFAGLTVPETARALELSPRTVNRLWTGARAWLHTEMR